MIKNPFNAILTKDEQKIFGFLGIIMIAGMLLHYSGISNIYASKTQSNEQSLAKSVEQDSLIRIDIRTADKETLILLPAIGDKRAEDIIAYRQTKQFESTEELLNIKGIGAKTYLNMKPMLLQFGTSGKGVTSQDKLKALSSDEPSSVNASAQNNKQALDVTAGTINKEQSKEKQESGKAEYTVRLNSASKEDLMSLDGIGEVKAGAIIEYRKTIGKFTSVEQLLDVKGIGPKTLEKNRHRLSL
jgi:competence protein ComEA